LLKEGHTREIPFSPIRFPLLQQPLEIAPDASSSPLASDRGWRAAIGRSGAAFAGDSACLRRPFLAPDKRWLGASISMASARAPEQGLGPSCLAGITATGDLDAGPFWTAKRLAAPQLSEIAFFAPGVPSSFRALSSRPLGRAAPAPPEKRGGLFFCDFSPGLHGIVPVVALTKADTLALPLRMGPALLTRWKSIHAFNVAIFARLSR
jgi:hypothetical protein